MRSGHPHVWTVDCMVILTSPRVYIAVRLGGGILFCVLGSKGFG